MAPQENDKECIEVEPSGTGEITAVSLAAAATTKGTVVISPPNNAPSYIRCNSQEPFVLNRSSSSTSKSRTSSNSGSSTTSTTTSAAEQVNQQLRLNLGQKWICPDESKMLLWIIRFCDKLFIRWWEPVLHYIIRHVLPTRWKRFITYAAWRVYYPIHAKLLGRSTAIHPDASLEYHALTTIMWWGRLFPVTVPRMRFALSQLTVWTRPSNDTTANSDTGGAASKATTKIEYIHETMILATSNNSGSNENTTNTQIPERQKEHTTVRGIFASYCGGCGDDGPQQQQQPTEYTIFWLYGGAFLSGDAQGNLGPACQIGTKCQMDVFLPTYRLVPEGTLEDCIWDVAVAYQWLCQRKLQQQKQQQAVDMGAICQKIILFGISSGAALCIKLTQTIAEIRRKETTLPVYLPSSFCLTSMSSDSIDNKSNNAKSGGGSDDNLSTTTSPGMPGGAVIMCPYIDYTEPKGSFLHYQKHDLIVNQRVMESGLPYLETHLEARGTDGKRGATHGRRRAYSPLYQSCQGLPPLCVVVSEHEVVYDQTIEFVNKCRSVGVNVTLGLWKYMCHVFCFLGGFAPEGEQSMNFVVDWINQHTTQTQQQPKETGK